MCDYLFEDVIKNLMRYLDLHSTYNLIDTCKQIHKLKYVICDKYIFHHCANVIESSYYDKIKYLQKICTKFPTSLKYLPSNLISLDVLISCDGDGHKCYEFDTNIESLPRSLQFLRIIDITFNQPLGKLPTKLKHLEIHSNSFDKSIDCLPDTIEVLKLHTRDFNQKVTKWPNSLEELYIESISWRCDMINLPSTLKKIRLDVTFLLQFISPPNLQLLTITFDVDNRHIKNPLPESLEYFMINNKIVINKNNYPHEYASGTRLSDLVFRDEICYTGNTFI